MQRQLSVARGERGASDHVLPSFGGAVTQRKRGVQPRADAQRHPRSCRKLCCKPRYDNERATIALNPQEIQVGILKRLRGTPIVRHDSEWQMVYNQHPPYEILQNKLIDFPTMQKLRRFARHWDLVGNSGNFLSTTPLIWRDDTSPFESFMRLSQWLHQKLGRTDSIALVRLMELLFDFLTHELCLDPPQVAESLWTDYKRGGRSDKPQFLRNLLSEEKPVKTQLNARKTALPKRQARHLVG